MVFGVCGGLGTYFGVDPVLIRLAFVLLGLTGTGILAYIVLAIVVPGHPSAEPEPAIRVQPGRGKELVGWGLVALGAILLADNVRLLGMDWDRLWPVLLVVVGFALLIRRQTQSYP
jgi:phage shock protein PspC (stress-responsive transcriptional regulator)